MDSKEKIKILGISGSPRRGGNSELLLDAALKGAAEAGAQVEKIVVSQLKIAPCDSSNACLRTGNCIIKDDMQEIYQKLLGANGIIFASPIFFLGISAQAKALIDRCQALWARKYILNKSMREAIGNSQRYGLFISTKASKDDSLFGGALLTIKAFFRTLDVSSYESLLFSQLEEKGAILKHPEALQQAQASGKRLSEQISATNKETNREINTK